MEHLKSYAKINLVLEVLSKRNDNYHNISSIFTLVNIYDDIYINFKKHSKWEIVLDVDNQELKKDNILFKLVNELNNYKQIGKFLVEIKLVKKIPVGGGLGGGSANAASFLFFLFVKNIINFEIAKNLSLKLGSDIFPIFVLYLFKFLYKKDILVLNFGKQDILIPLNIHFINPYYILFIFPGIKVLTKEAFLLLNKKVLTSNEIFSNFIGIKTKNFILNLIKSNVLNYDFFYNEFEDVVLNNYPQLNHLKEQVEKILKEIGINEYKFLLSGSGSTFMFFIPKKYNPNEIKDLLFKKNINFKIEF